MKTLGVTALIVAASILVGVTALIIEIELDDGERWDFTCPSC